LPILVEFSLQRVAKPLFNEIGGEESGVAKTRNGTEHEQQITHFITLTIGFSVQCSSLDRTVIREHVEINIVYLD
jgi:hypothetical protein